MPMRRTEHINGELPMIYSYKHSTNRSPRLRTRMTHVQNSEDQLHKKRQHCKFTSSLLFPTAELTTLLDVNVVQAFESALRLLGQAG
jgi:hypothetical protein